MAKKIKNSLKPTSFVKGSDIQWTTLGEGTVDVCVTDTKSVIPSSGYSRYKLGNTDMLEVVRTGKFEASLATYSVREAGGKGGEYTQPLNFNGEDVTRVACSAHGVKFTVETPHKRYFFTMYNAVIKRILAPLEFEAYYPKYVTVPRIRPMTTYRKFLLKGSQQ